MTKMHFSDELRDGLARARHVVVFTGAGVSAESGVPTFRDALTGLWTNFRPEDLATPEGFLAHPRRVWEWYAWRRELAKSVRPNPAHLAIARLQFLVSKLTLITQNVDGLHQRAGSRAVLELHGNIHRVKCFENQHPAENWNDAEEKPPRCAACGSFLRPDVVWFQEELPAQTFAAAQGAVSSCDVLFSVGTSMRVYPAADLPLMALRAGARVVQINPEPTDLDAWTRFNLHGKAGEILPPLLDAVWNPPDPHHLGARPELQSPP